MGYLFLDIETFVDEKNMKSGLNPFEEESKVILISYNYYPNEPVSKRDIKTPTFLKEWESDEKKILTQFYEFIKKTVKNDIHETGRCGLKLIGYNVIGFDLMYLFGRMSFHEIDSDNNLMEYLIVRPFKIDLSQISAMISYKITKYHALLPVNQPTANKFFNLPTKQGSGLDVSNYYKNREYEKIMKYAIEEFTFERLYLSFMKLISETQKSYTSKDKESRLVILNKIVGRPLSIGV